MSDVGEETEEEITEVVSEGEGEEVQAEEVCVSAPRGTPRQQQQQQQQTALYIPEVVDDFLRNFLRRLGLRRTLNMFESEWYSSPQRTLVPDALTHRHLLQRELEEVRRDTGLLTQEVQAVLESLVTMKRERDFHWQQHEQAVEDKKRLTEDVRRLKRQLQSYGPALRQLEDKYQAALRQKTLAAMEKDQTPNASDTTTRTRTRKQEKSQTDEEQSVRSSSSDKTSARSHSRETPRRPTPRPTHAASPQGEPRTSFSWTCSIRAHQLPISCISLHPHRALLASASDDRSWRLWRLPDTGEKVGQMLLTGEGHSDWLSSCSFHPDGSKLATTSGDTTVRVWETSLGRCVLTLSAHSQPTWGCSFHPSGLLLASCSADRTVKLWDLTSRRCRLTLRRHAASINSVCFLPSSDLLLTCSADKTLALWDARLAICTATLHGHLHPCSHATTSPAGDVLASCDSRGVVNLWDIRKPELATATVDTGPLGANQLAFSPSGRTLAVACSDGLVRLVQVDSCAVSSLSGHTDAVQSVTFDHTGETVMSAGSDGVINVWT